MHLKMRTSWLPRLTFLRACIFLFLLLPAAGHSEQREQSVSVELTREADAHSIEVLWAVRDRVTAHPGLVYQDLLVRLDTDPLQSVAGALRNLENGRRQYERVDVVSAAKSLERATMVLSGWPDHRQNACEGLFLLSQVYTALKRPKQARRALERILHLDQDFKAPDGAPPSVRRGLKKVRRRLAARNKQMRIEVSTGVAAVYIDGVSAGPTPLRLRRLSAGAHHLRLSMDGYRHWYGILHVGHTPKKVVRMKPASRADLYKQVRRSFPQAIASAEFTSALSELRALASSDQAILLGQQSGGNLSAVLFDLKRQKQVRRILVQTGKSRAETADEIVGRLYEGLDPSALIAPLSLIETEASVEKSLPDWMMWGSVTLGVAAAIIIPVVLLSDDAAQPSSKTGIVLEF